MEEKLKAILAKIKAWWSKYTTKQKTIIVVISAAVVFTFVIISVVISRPKYQTLITCSSQSESASVISILESENINYQTSTSGLSISVDEGDISKANLALGAAGYIPEGYSKLSDYLDNSLSTTSSDKEKFYKEYKEKKLEEDFSNLSNVKSAKVHLSIPEQNGTLLQNSKESSAYIQLELNGTFTSANAANLAQATATFLGNSNTANITILDSDSNLLFAGGDDYSTSGIASSLQELENQAESMVANQVKKVLLGTNQYDDIEVSSHLSMDYSSYEKTVSEYYSNEGRTEGMLSNERNYSSENENSSGGVPGTDSNGDNAKTYMFRDNDNSSSSTEENEKNYLPNQSLLSTITPAGGIIYSDSSVSITALKYKKLSEEDAKTQGLLDGISWEKYKLANDVDKKLEVDEEFYQVVANATGIAPDKITIVAYETPIFYDKEPIKVSWTDVLSVSLLVLILALLAVVVLKSMQARSNVSEEEELSVENLLQSTPESELEDIDVESKSETRKMVEKFVDENPEAAAALLRNWLNEDWD